MKPALFIKPKNTSTTTLSSRFIGNRNSRQRKESLHALACPSKSQAGGRDPAIYVLIKHFFGRFFVPFVHFVPFRG